MRTKQGFHTRNIATKLRENFKRDHPRYSGIRVYFDHGNKGRNKTVCRPIAYMGRRYGADATLAGLDIVLVQDGSACLLVEIEEDPSTRPKTIVGDIFATLLSDNIRIKTKSYPIRTATFLVALAIRKKGKRLQKYARLKRHIGKYLEAFHKAGLACGVKKIQIITCEKEDMERRIEKAIRRETGRLMP